jgi:hypothetical protein
MGRRRPENPTKAVARPARRRWVNARLLAFLAVTLAVKLVVVSQLQHHPLLQPEGGLDMAAYLRLARQVMAGDVALGPGLYFLSPLYIYFLAGALSISESLTFVRVLQAALGTAAVGCIFSTARVWYGERAGWIAAALAALTGVFTFYEAVVLQSALDVFLTSTALYFLSRGLLPPEGAPHPPEGGSNRNSKPAAFAFRSKDLVFAGLVFGVQTLNRPNILIGAVGIVVVLLAGGSRTAPTGAARVRAAALLLAGLLIGLLPIVLRNAIVARQFALTSSQGGLNFYIGNNPAATGQYNAVPGVRANIEGQSEDTRQVAEKAAGRSLSDAEVSAHFTGLGAAWIRSHPAAAARLFAKKLALVFNARHQWLDFSYPYYAYDAGTILWLLFVGPWLLVPLGLAGLALRVRRRPPSPLRPTSRLDRFVETGGSGETGEIRDRAYFAWASFVPFYAVGVAVFFVGERYRLPLFVPLCVSAGGALSWIAEALRRRDSIRAPVVIVLAAAAVAFWPFALDDGRFDERLRLSKVLMNRGDYGAAAMELERAHALNPSHTIAEFNLGMALVSSGRPAEGIAHVRRAVDAGVAMPGARYALAGALLGTGDRDGAARILRAAAPAPEDSAESCYRVALLALDAGAPDVAERYARRALALKPGWPEAAQLLAQLLAERR